MEINGSAANLIKVYNQSTRVSIKSITPVGSFYGGLGKGKRFIHDLYK